MYIVHCIRRSGWLTRYSEYATAWTVRGSSHYGGDIFQAAQTGPEAHPVTCSMATGSFPGVNQSQRGADYTTPSSAGLRTGWSCLRLSLFLCGNGMGCALMSTCLSVLCVQILSVWTSRYSAMMMMMILTTTSFHRNVSKFLRTYTASYSRRHNSS